MTIEERVAQLEKQQALQSRALREIVEGRWSGELPHAAATVVELMGGTPPHGFAPLEYPRPTPAQPAPVPPGYNPRTLQTVPGVKAGAFSAAPKGVILHGSRSGQPYGVDQEYAATVNYVRSGASGLGWNATIGDDTVAVHLAADEWGWNARGHSQDYLAVEFAQATVARDITDGQVRAVCWWFARCRKRWPSLPLVFPTHAELPAGKADGKSDVFPLTDPRVNDLRARILARLGEQGVR